MLKQLLGGAAVGAANGLFGGGGGMIAVPLLLRMGRPARRAHATAIAVILPASLVSAAVYLFKGAVPLAVLLPVALGVTLGGFLGARLLPKVPVRALGAVFSAFMLAAGLGMVLS